jgi:hypothetical protein
LEDRTLLFAPVGVVIFSLPDPSNVTLQDSEVSLHDSADLEGGSNPDGTLTFTLMGPGNTVVFSEPVPVGGNGIYGTPLGYTLPQSGTVAGNYQWNLDYSDDPVNGPASDDNEPDGQVTVSNAAPLLNTFSQPSDAQLGFGSGILGDQANLSGGYFPTGTITFTLYQGSTLVHTEDVPVNGNGTYNTNAGYSLPTTGTAAGDYQWDAAYNGDSNNESVDDNGDPSAQVTVEEANPEAETSPNPSFTTLNDGSQLLQDSATLEEGYYPTGKITFTLEYGSTPVDTEMVSVSGNGEYTTPGYTLPTTGTVTGQYQWNVSYSGDSNNVSLDDIGDPDNLVSVVAATPLVEGTPNPGVPLWACRRRY